LQSLLNEGDTGQQPVKSPARLAQAVYPSGRAALFLSTAPEITDVTKLKLYYEGWLALPASFRQALGLDTNAMLEAELVEGTIVLRPASKGRGPARTEPKAAGLPTGGAPAVALPADMPVKRKPGRPRKVQTAEQAEPAAPRPRGRPRKVMLEPVPEVAAPMPMAAPSVLRRKVLPPVTGDDHLAVHGYRKQAMADAGREPEERRPFPHVEVRKLGPGRGYNRLRETDTRYRS